MITRNEKRLLATMTGERKGGKLKAGEPCSRLVSCPKMQRLCKDRLDSADTGA